MERKKVEFVGKVTDWMMENLKEGSMFNAVLITDLPDGSTDERESRKLEIKNALVKEE